MSSKNYASAYVAGFNQSKKYIRNGKTRVAYVASDAENAIVSEISFLCQSFGVKLDTSKTKGELGTLCGLEVDCAVCVIPK